MVRLPGFTMVSWDVSPQMTQALLSGLQGELDWQIPTKYLAYSVKEMRNGNGFIAFVYFFFLCILFTDTFKYFKASLFTKSRKGKIFSQNLYRENSISLITFIYTIS